MLPDIGLMIGFYIITRMLSLFKNDKSVVIRIFSIITIIIAIICTLDLFCTGLPKGVPLR